MGDGGRPLSGYLNLPGGSGSPGRRERVAGDGPDEMNLVRRVSKHGSAIDDEVMLIGVGANLIFGTLPANDF